MSAIDLKDLVDEGRARDLTNALARRSLEILKEELERAKLADQPREAREEIQRLTVELTLMGHAALMGDPRAKAEVPHMRALLSQWAARAEMREFSARVDAAKRTVRRVLSELGMAALKAGPTLLGL